MSAATPLGQVSFNPFWPSLVCDDQGQDYAWVADFAALEDQRLWPGCRLVDSQGGVYLLSQENTALLYWHRQAELVSLPKLDDELKRHAANLGICCTAKLAIRTLAAAFALVLWLEQH